MDARACNLEQAALIHRPDTPEPDSIVELFGLLAVSSRLTALARLTRRLAHSNLQEGGYERQVPGDADRLVRSLRDGELNGGGEAVLASKSIARALRGPLRELCAATRVDIETLRAMRAVENVLRRSPALQVLSGTVAHELGAEKYALLQALLEDRAAGPGKHDAGSGGPAGVATLGHGEGPDGP